MKKDYYRIARYTLIFSTLGFLLCYPFRAKPMMGFLASVFSAAMVGGVADWFAVTALFRRPLGIAPGKLIRTEIITVNRERFTNDLANMVRDELLTSENLKKELNSISISGILINYLAHGGSKNVKIILNRLLQDLLTLIDPDEVGVLGEEILKKNTSKMKIAPFILETLDYTFKQGYDQKIVDFIIAELQRVTENQQLRLILIKLIKETKLAYEKGMKRRQFINGLLDISPMELASKGQEAMAKLLTEIKNDDQHPARQYLQDRVELFYDGLKNNFLLKERLEAWKNDQIEQKLNLRDEISGFYRKERELQTARLGETIGIRRLIGNLIDNGIEEFKSNKKQQENIDQFIKNILMQLVDEKQSQISNLVQESLNGLSDKELVSTLEEKAGNDLQIIRVSGAVVGGTVGGILFLVNRFLS